MNIQTEQKQRTTPLKDQTSLNPSYSKAKRFKGATTPRITVVKTTMEHNQGNIRLLNPEKGASFRIEIPHQMA